ncbi:tape measure protein [Faecalibacterium sp.]|uniref:tape measure protein n=1 Tax=Faecalibacterium sp. TaxID=1971605 RepID=UPI003A957677
MSKEVDERVVEMRFNNALFENKVQQTMRSLTALNEKLMFKGAEKGFEKVSDASEKVKFNALLNALDNLSQKFSAVEVIGVTALMRITNQAVDAGERLVKALSLDPIISGFQEYETQINAVQTILANTSSKGTTLDQVNAALDELNHYADLTIYNFTEMTRNIGTFTAAGVDLNTSVSAIKGIANLAAVSGSTSQQASTAMYQLSQALASGTVKLQDWNSVVNAGMGGQVFQDALKETARVHGIAIDSMIKKEGSFRETLSKGWLTSSILTETLQKFTGNLNEETLKSIGYTDEQIKKIMEMGKTANDAATKVKTFSQLKDTLTEALQSGWTQTWQTIIGDFEEAKELFTRFSDVFSDLINKSSEARNTVLAGGLNSGWQQLNTALGDSADFYSQMLEKVMLANGSISQKQIDDAGSFAKALQQGGVSAEQLQDGLKESYKQLSALGALSDDALKAKKLDPAQVRSLAKSFEEVNQKVADGSLNLDIYSKKIGELSGREHLIESIWNVFEALEKVVEPVARAWQKIFSPITADQIYNIAKSIDEFTAKLSISDETADKIERTFSGIFAVLNVWKNVLLTVGKVLGEVFNAVSPLAGGFLSITASLGDCLVEMANAVNNSKTFKTTLDGIHWIIGKVSEGMQTFAGVLTDVSNNVSVVFDPLKILGEWFENFISFITPKLKWLADKIGEIFEELGSGASGAFGNLNGNALWGFANAGMIAGLIAGIKGFLEAFKDIGSTVKDTIGGVAELLNKLGEAVTAWKNNKNAETLKTISTAVAILAGSLVVLSMVKPERLAASTGAMIALFAELLVALAIYDEIAKKTKKVGKGTSSMVVMAAGVLILTSALKKISEIETGKLLTSVIALGAVMAELVAAQVAISKWAKDGAKHAMSMLAMAAAVRVLAEAVEQLADLGWDGIEKGLIAVAGLLAEVAAFSGLSNFGGLTAGKAVGILVLAAALSALEKSVSAFSKMPVDELQNGIGALGAILGEIAVFSMLSNPAEHVLSTATALTILSGGLLILSNALANLGGMTLGQIGVALAAMAGGLIEMGIALTLVKGSFGSATSFLIMSVVLNALVFPLKSLGEMSLEEIGHGLLAVGGALGIFAIAVGTMSLAGPIVIAVSAALSLLAGSFALLLGTMAAVSLMPLRMEALVVALGTLGSAIGVFIAGVIAGLGTAAGSIAIAVAEIIVAVCNAIAQAVPAIGNALAQLIVTICNVIVQCSEPIGQALFTLGTVVIQTIIDLIAWAWDGGGEGGGIKGALSELLGNIVAWLSEHLNPIKLFGGLLGTISGFFGKIGEYMSQGLANGLNTGASVQIANNGVQTLCNKVKDFFRNAFGINSPSTWMRELGQWFAPGLINGLNGTASIAKLNAGTKVFGENVKSGLSGTFDGLNSWMFNKGSDAASSFYNGLGAAKNVRTGSKDDWFDEWYEKEISKYRNVTPNTVADDAAEDILGTLFGSGDTSPTGSGGTTTGKTKKSSGSGTKKTMAQQIEEKYKPKLEANKAAREALDSEYELWQTENQYSADEDTLLAKKMENAAAEIANQTERVAIAQAKYDEMLKRWGADKTKTKEAYANLLSEKTSLAKLQADQYTGLFEDITKRYDTDLGTLEKEYNLWTAQNSNTASKLDKIDRETEYQKNELELKQKKEAKAKEQWETLRKEYGESDLRTKEAWNDYLDAQTESLQLQNDIAKQSLNKLDAQLSIIKDEQSRMQSRMDLLTSIYGDGSLKDREDAYKQAVEQYGENSAEARKAKYQGITTSILGTVEALQNMNAELEKTRLIQQQLADGKALNGNPLSKDDVNDLKDQLLSSRSSMVSFAGALADAMGLEDSAKSAVVKLANAIQKNWVPISNACSEVWTKVSGAMGEEMTNTLSTVFKAAFSEEGMEIGTEFVSAIASAMQGDYAGAIISAATGLIDLLFTDTGKQLTGGAGDMLLKLFSGIQNGDLAGKLANIGTAAANVGNSLSGLLPMLGQLGTTGAGAGMAVGGIGEALGGLGASILAVLPELLIVVGIIAAIAALIGGIAWFISSRKKEKATGAKDVGSEIDKGISDGVKEDAPIVDDAVSDMTENAMDIAKGTLGTISKVMGDDYEYTPQIVPVVDLTNVLEGADEIDNAFAATKSLSLDGDVSRNLANKIDAEAQLQNGLKSAGNEDTLRAINALAGHMDGVAESIKGMSVTINGRKAIGYIDDRMGRLTAAKVK